MSIGIMKTLRWFGRQGGRVLDADDRKFLAQAFVLVSSGAGLLVIGAGAFGLAVRVFNLAAG
jgi:hypothetical protein